MGFPEWNEETVKAGATTYIGHRCGLRVEMLVPPDPMLFLEVGFIGAHLGGVCVFGSDSSGWQRLGALFR